MRRVVNSDQVYHLWAHQAQTSAWNSSRSVSFDGAVAYSYRAKIGAIFKNKRGTLVLLCSDRFSVTTGRHQYHLRRAVSHMHAIECPHIVPKRGSGNSDLEKAHHDLNLAYFVAKMERLHKEAQRVMSESAVQWRAERAVQLHKDMADYLIFFGIRRKMPALLSFAAAFERAHRIDHPDPASLDKREREKAKRTAERQALVSACTRTAWRLDCPEWGVPPGYWRLDGPVMLRIRDDEIETSMGARIPLDHAPILWRAIQRVIASGEPYVRNGHTLHAGPYAVDRIDPDGTMTAGCHTIPASELRMMARQLRLAGTVAEDFERRSQGYFDGRYD